MKKRIIVIALSSIIALLFSAWFVFNFAMNAIAIGDVIDAMQGISEKDNYILTSALLKIIFLNACTIVLQFLLSFKFKIERNITNVISIIISGLALGLCALVVIDIYDINIINMEIYGLLLAILPLTVFIISLISQINEIKKLFKKCKNNYYKQI